MLNKIKLHETACQFSPFLLPVKPIWTVEEASGCGYPSVLTNPIFWLIPLGANEAPVCGYCLVLAPFLNTRTPPWIWCRSSNGYDITDLSCGTQLIATMDFRIFEHKCQNKIDFISWPRNWNKIDRSVKAKIDFMDPTYGLKVFDTMD